MILSKQAIKQFEQEQKDYGTETALFNFLADILIDLFRRMGVRGRIHLGDKK